MSALPAFLAVLAVLRLFGGRAAGALGLASDRPLERSGLALALAFAALTLAVFLMSVLRVVTFASSAGLLLLMAWGGASERGVAIFDLRAAWRKLGAGKTAGWMLGSLAAGVLLLSLVAAMAPPTGMDALHFHFVAVKRMLVHGGLPDDPSILFHRTGGFYFPYLFGFALQGDLLAKLLNFAAGAAAVGLTAATAERLGTGAGAPAAAAAALSPVVAAYWGSDYLEMPAFMYIAAAVHASVRLSQGDGARWGGAAFAFLGFALGIKASVFFAVFLAVPVLSVVVRRIRSTPLVPLAWGAAAGLVGAGFFVVWNAFSVGSASPVYSFGSGAPTDPAVDRGGAVLTIAGWLLTSSPYWSDSLGPLLITGVAGALLFEGPSGGRRLALHAVLLAAAYLATLVVALPHYLQPDTHAHVRYVFPGLVPLMAPATGLLLLRALAGPPVLRRFAMLAVLVTAAFVLPVKAARTAVAFPAAVGLESSHGYLSRKIETYEACRAADRLPEEARLLPLVHRPYFLDRPYADPWRFPRNVRTADAFVEALRELNVTHVLVEPRASVRYGIPDDDRFFADPRFHEVQRWWHWDPRKIRLYEFLGD